MKRMLPSICSWYMMTSSIAFSCVRTEASAVVWFWQSGSLLFITWLILAMVSAMLVAWPFGETARAAGRRETSKRTPRTAAQCSEARVRGVPALAMALD